jgi:hypothetical protein
MKIFQPGQIWRDRSGNRLGILYVIDNIDFPIIAISDKKILYRFKKEGHYIDSKIRHDRDLIDEVTDK